MILPAKGKAVTGDLEGPGLDHLPLIKEREETDPTLLQGRLAEESLTGEKAKDLNLGQTQRSKIKK